MAVKRTKTARRSGSMKKSIAKSAKRAKSGKAAVAKLKAAKAASARGKAPQKIPQKIAGGAVVKVVEGALDEMKAVNVRVLDVRKLTDIADTMIIASGNSDRHVRSIADRVVEHAKKAGYRPMGVEGERDGEWVLLDLQDVIVHVMLPRVREFYGLESLWDVSAARREAAVAGA
jgi:ribosome-associated protein